MHQVCIFQIKFKAACKARCTLAAKTVIENCGQLQEGRMIQSYRSQTGPSPHRDYE